MFIILGKYPAGDEWHTTAGMWNGGHGAVDGFQMLFNSGNIASGTVKVYGRL